MTSFYDPAHKLGFHEHYVSNVITDKVDASY